MLQINSAAVGPVASATGPTGGFDWASVIVGLGSAAPKVIEAVKKPAQSGISFPTPTPPIITGPGGGGSVEEKTMYDVETHNKFLLGIIAIIVAWKLFS